MRRMRTLQRIWVSEGASRLDAAQGADGAQLRHAPHLPLHPLSLEKVDDAPARRCWGCGWWWLGRRGRGGGGGQRRPRPPAHAASEPSAAALSPQLQVSPSSAQAAPAPCEEQSMPTLCTHRGQAAPPTASILRQPRRSRRRSMWSISPSQTVGTPCGARVSNNPAERGS